VLEPGRNLGGAARTLGATHVAAPYVAFADDDSWWRPGSLARAADVLDRHSGLALVAARVLVGEEQREDPVCVALAASPLGLPAEGPGRAVLGFVACGAVVRRDAFLAAGGFHPRFGVGGEERLLAVDLACAGWRLAYVPEVVAVHDPSPIRDADRRRRIQSRNGLWTDWLRRPFASAASSSLAIVRRALVDPAARGALLDACAGISWVLAARSVVPADIERALRLLDAK
jgi:GT2 family glycosyltransferase